MSDAIPVSVHKAVYSRLKTASLSQKFEPKRNYANWRAELKELGCLRVDVVLVSTGWQSELFARGQKLKYLVPIDIAVRYRFGTENTDDDTGELDVEKIDQLILLVQEIHELFTEQRCQGFEAGVWEENRILVAPLIPALRDRRQFTGINRTTFRVERSLS